MPLQVGKVSGSILLDSAELTAQHTKASATGPSYEDLSGMTLDFTVGDRPVLVSLSGGAMTGGGAGSRIRVLLTDGSNNQKAYSQATLVAASEHHPVGAMAWLIPAGSGAVTAKARVGVFTGTGTAIVFADTDGRVTLTAVEV